MTAPADEPTGSSPSAGTFTYQEGREHPITVEFGQTAVGLPDLSDVVVSYPAGSEPDPHALDYVRQLWALVGRRAPVFVEPEGGQEGYGAIQEALLAPGRFVTALGFADPRRPPLGPLP